MAGSRSVFVRLADDLAACGLGVPAGWGSDRRVRVLAGPTEALTVLREAWQGDPTAANRLMSALLAAGDEVSRRVVLAGLAPGLDALTGNLSRGWQAERGEVEAMVAAAVWALVGELAGGRVGWPARTILDGVGHRVRVELRREARRAARQEPLADGSHLAGVDGRMAVEERLALAARARTVRVSTAAVELVWSTRVDGIGLAEAAARAGRSMVAARALRSRAERLLRASA